MRAYPDVRGAKPRKWQSMINFIPTVQVWANMIMIGFWQQPKQGEFNPILRRPFFSYSRTLRKWSINR